MSERDPAADAACSSRNVATPERYASVAAGLALGSFALRRGGAPGAILAAAAGALVARGLTGRSRLYRALRTGTARVSRSPVASVPHGQGVRVERAVTIARPAAELYRFWRDLRNLPRLFDHLESVTALDAGRSRWIARVPGGGTVDWEAAIHNEIEGELLAWRSLPGADVASAGSVRFEPVPGGRGTEVRVVLEVLPPGGRLATAAASLLGEDPEREVREALRRLKQLAEAGEIPTNAVRRAEAGESATNAVPRAEAAP